MTDTIIQIIIFASACGAIALISRKEHWNRWGYIIGIIGQPLWIYDSYKNNQWGIFVVSVWFLISYAQGIRNYWIKPDKPSNSNTSMILELPIDVIKGLENKAMRFGRKSAKQFATEILTWIGS